MGLSTFLIGGDFKLKALKKYSEELGVEMSLDELIDSHRYLRSLNLEVTTERNKVIQEAVDLVKSYKDAKGLISRVDLKSMTVEQFTSWIWEINTDS